MKNEIKKNTSSRSRWKRLPKQTGLSRIFAGPRGYIYHDGEKTLATISPLINPKTMGVQGWYYVVSSDARMPYVNTCGTPCESLEQAKAAAAAYVKQHLKQEVKK